MRRQRPPAKETRTRQATPCRRGPVAYSGELIGLSQAEASALIGDTAVFCGSGPSLLDVDPWSYGGSVIAISTAIRCRIFDDRMPDAWVHLDPVNQNHGHEGRVAWRHPDVLNVFPAWRHQRRVNHDVGPKHQGVPSFRSPGEDHKSQRDPFDGHLPLLHGCHKSTIFGIQWLHWLGVHTVYWVGHDLGGNDGYCYTQDKPRRRVERPTINSLTSVLANLTRWCEFAKQRGFRWITDSPGPTNAFMEKHERGIHPEAAGGSGRGSAPVRPLEAARSPDA